MPSSKFTSSKSASSEFTSSKSTASSPEQTIKLDQFLKWVGAAQTGGEAKLLIQSGEVTVNGTIETRRGRKLVAGDRVTVMGENFTVQSL